MKAAFVERDLLLRPLGNTIYVMPPYCLNEADHALIEAAIVKGVEAVAG